MKIKTKNVLWLMLGMAALPGCASVQSSPVYQRWQEQAYGAYGMAAPPMYSNPYLVTVMPYAPAPPDLLAVSAPVSMAEQQYVAQYYSLN